MIYNTINVKIPLQKQKCILIKQHNKDVGMYIKHIQNNLGKNFQKICFIFQDDEKIITDIKQSMKHYQYETFYLNIKKSEIDSLKIIKKIEIFIQDSKLTRDDIIIVVGNNLKLEDIVGYIAGTYLRGINYGYISTSNLPDYYFSSTIKGKTIISSDLGRNIENVNSVPLFVIQNETNLIGLSRTKNINKKIINLGAIGGNQYNILIGSNLLEDICNRILALKEHNENFKKICIVTDSNVAPIYLGKLKSRLEKESFIVNDFIFQAGEKSKTEKTVQQIRENFCINGITSDDLIIALGGGVCGDMVAFASGTYGVNFIQIPTSNLAMNDSSVGGKAAVDTDAGKNLKGIFNNPVAVFIDVSVLKTLPEREFNSGMAEAIKMGAILNPELYELIEKSQNAYELLLNSETDGINLISKITYGSINPKAEIVQIDPYDKGIRGILNYGHTLGHAVEKLSNFGLTHGEAVSIGMCLVAQASEKNGLINNGYTERLIRILKKYKLPTECPFSIEEVLKIALSTDKKRINNGIKFILPSNTATEVKGNLNSYVKIESLSKDKIFNFFKIS